MFVFIISKLSTDPVSTSFETTSRHAEVVFSTDITDCRFSAPICALEFTVGPSDPPSNPRVLKPQPDKNRTRTNHRITSTQNEAHQ